MEDRVHVTCVGTEVEDGVEVEAAGQLGVGGDDVAERPLLLPDAFLALDYMLDRFAWLVEGLVVRPERMRQNLEASHGLFFSQRVLLALVESGLPRDEAYLRVQQSAMRAWEEERPFRDIVAAEPELAGRLDLDAVFDLGAYTRHVDTVFDRLHGLTRTKEGVHA